MVNLLRTVHLGVSALVLATFAFASPIPNPHHPQVGEIVHYDPHHGSGIAHKVSSFLAGHKATHITVGHDHQGHAILAPVVSHEQGLLRPSASAKGMGSLHGVVLLDHTVTADPKHIHHASGKNKGHVIGKEHLDKIQGGQALVQAHITAAAALDKSHQAHSEAANAHREAAKRYHEAGHHELAKTFENMAHEHHAISEKEESTANIHRGSALFVHGADAKLLKDTQRETQLAKVSGAQGHGSADVANYAVSRLNAQQ